MKTAGIIIDFDNIFKRPISHYSDEDIKRVLTMTIGMLRDQDPDIECVRIRLWWLVSRKQYDAEGFCLEFHDSCH